MYFHGGLLDVIAALWLFGKRRGAPDDPRDHPGMPGEKQEPFTVYRITADAEDPEVYGQY